MRHSIRGLIIKDKKVLLVRGYDADFFWTPGGGVEGNETHEETLRRELDEELGVQLVSMTYYASFEYDNRHIDNYLIEIEGDIVMGAEVTAIGWYGSGSDINPSTGFISTVWPRLLADGLVT